MKQLQLCLFGSFEARLDGVPITQFEAATARGLLAYLAVERSPLHPRTSLATLLWGADAGSTGTTNLRSCLRRVRAALGEEESNASYLTITQESIALDPQTPVWTDVEAFEALLAQTQTHAHHRLHDCPWCMTRLAGAVALYRGPFLSGVEVNSLFFEEWRLLNQERLQRLTMQALYTLADHHFRRERYAEAEQLARRQIALEPWCEEAHQQLMRVFQATGQRSAALAQYQRCQQLLRQHLDVEPLPETTALADAIKQQGGSRHNPAPFSLAATPQPSPGALHNLPQNGSSFLGRAPEIDHLLKQIVNSNQPVVTLVGEGGVGKTRLALAVAARLVGSFRDGVWFVALAGLAGNEEPLRLQDQVASTIADALGYTLNQQPPRLELLTRLRKAELLLVLDNFEHLLAAAGWLKQLTHAAPHLTLLITSRQRLNLQNETVVRLQGLPMPTVDGVDGEDPSAVELFVQRAVQRWPAFQLQPADLPAVVQICQIVRGLPLGIELAAALVHQMTPAAIVTALTNGLDLLENNHMDAPARQRTMRAVFNSSWRLLSDPERRLLAAVTVFRGGFERAAASAVAAATPTLLAELYEKALLQQESNGRFEVHELLRQFGQECTVVAELENLRAKHSHYYLGLLSQNRCALHGQAVAQALALMRSELDNLRAAWGWAVENRQFHLLRDHAGDLRCLYHLLGLWPEGEHLLRRAAACLTPEAAPGVVCAATEETVAVVLGELAEILFAQGNYGDAIATARRLVKLGRQAQQPAMRARGHLVWGKTDKEQGRLAHARRRLGVAQALAGRAGVAKLEADALYHLGSVAHHLGDKRCAHLWLEEALSRYRRLDARLEEANALSALSQVYYNDPSKVYQFTAQRLELARRVGSKEDEYRALHRLSILWLNTGDYAQAQACCQQALALAQTLHCPPYVVSVLDFLALSYHYLGDDLTALHYLEQTVQLCTETSEQRGLAYALHWEGQVLLTRGELNNAAACYAQAADLRLVNHQPHLAAQSQAGLARVRLAQGRGAEALALIEPIVAQLADLRSRDVEDPCMLWLNCYLVLRAHQHAQARAVLEQAYTIVQERAARISDPTMRQNFLQRIAVNRQLVEAWQAEQTSPPQPSQNRLRRQTNRERKAVSHHTPAAPLPPNRFPVTPSELQVSSV